MEILRESHHEDSESRHNYESMLPGLLTRRCCPELPDPEAK